MNKSILSFFSPADKILLFCVSVIGLLSLGIKSDVSDSGHVAVVQSGDVKMHVPLDRNRDIPIEWDEHRIVLRIENKSIRILYADCPRQYCVHSGPVRAAGDILICVPNKLVIRIEGKKKNSFDVITG